jgi:hypothetical protein
MQIVIAPRLALRRDFPHCMLFRGGAHTLQLIETPG